MLEECKPMLDTINEQGPQLSALTPGEGATRVDDIITRDNNKFSSAAEKIKGHADRLKMQRSKSAEVRFCCWCSTWFCCQRCTGSCGSFDERHDESIH